MNFRDFSEIKLTDGQEASSGPYLGSINHIDLLPAVLLYFNAVQLFNNEVMSSPITFELPKYQLLKQRLITQFPDIDEETLTDTLEGITDLHEMIAALIRSALVDEALSTGLRKRLEDMRERLDRLEERGAKKRQLALEAMDEVGLSKLQQADFTASTRPGSPSLVVTAEGEVPSPYWLPQPPRMDRQSLLGELKRGTEIPGVQLNNPKSVLVVRTK